MKENKLKIQINKPRSQVFSFTITPPNSSLWIPGMISETTNEMPVKVGTIYTLKTKNRKFKVIVAAIKENEYVEWSSEDKKFHCRYTYTSVDDNSTELEYFEWIEKGDLDDPFNLEILQRLKNVLES
ncbi:MAG: hypothetical protein ACREHC_08755 [Candidatus Levyibacteriota bacterium]